MAATLGELATQLRSNFISVGAGGGGTGTTGATGATGVTINVPTGPTGTTGTTGSSPSSTTSTGWINSILNWLTQPGSATGSFLLRLLLFVLGLILIAGAIYLYKGSNPVLAIPGRLAKGAVKAGSAALKAAGQSEE